MKNEKDLISILAGIAPALFEQVAGQYRRAENKRLGLGDHLLVDAGLRAAHNDVVLLRVDLGIKACIANKVDNPQLRLLLAHAQLICQGPDVDALMDPTVRLKNEKPCRLNKFVAHRLEKIISCKHALAAAKVVLCTIEIEVHNQALEELRNGITIRVTLLLNRANKILHSHTSTRARNHSSSKVPENMGTIGLDCLNVAVCEQKINELGAKVGGRRHFRLEINEKTPMNKPSSLLKLLKRICEVLKTKLNTW
mmetsp:Transcript_44392/g.118433  ORF Transcript_44392/g.118433 Transcript_44392/m.118433 type:complete len:253 (+) Transcript_44392:921-1679(+)